MAGGNKKKKTKPAANPARGFATTSTVSKKVTAEDASEGTPQVSKNAVVNSSTTPDDARNSTEPHQSAQDQRELHELSPEELEAQLESSDLQQFVEQHAAKVRKESTRQVSRLQTDKRVLRGQADYLSVRDWLPDELMQQILDITADEASQDTAPTARKQERIVGDDLISKVWALRLCLLALDVPSLKVNEVLTWLVSSPLSIDDAGPMWGLPEALHWLSFNCDTDELSDYDFQKPKAIVHEADEATPTDQEPEPKKGDSPLSKDVSNVSTDIEDESLDVSDVGSDLEPDELQSTYLRTKSTLFEINPDFEATRSSKKRGKGTKTANGAGTTPSNSEKKLLQKLQKIESDLLFDQRVADVAWATTKIQLARDASDRKRLQLSNAEPDGNALPPTKLNGEQTNGISDEAEQLGLDLLKESEDPDDVDILGGMFSALPGVSQSSPADGGNEGVSIRDFGRLTGMNPKRLVEDLCKARDSRVQLVYKMVSPTTYASRHALTVKWSKEQEPIDASFLPAVEVTSKPRNYSLIAIGEATPDVAQSEAYIATTALFVIFSGSPKEEKAHLRLPPAFRDLWDEYTQKKQEHAHAADRETVKELRKLVEQHTRPDDDEDDTDEVVFNANSRYRSAAASGTATPTSKDIAPKSQPQVHQELLDMWHRKVSTPSYQRMLHDRMNLPMYHFRDVALEAIERHQVVIARGETGSGKSTQLPAFILENELSQGRQCKVYCTEPRRISAISLAHRVSEEMGERKGELGSFRSLVGYAIRLESQTSAQTRLVYATTGIVLRMLENADGLGDITHLVIDEVHERSIDTDFLLIMLRSLLIRKPDLKVVLMSATVDAQKFSDYLDGAPIIDVPGRTHPVRAMFLEDAVEATGHTNEDAASGTTNDDDEFAEPEEQGKVGGHGQLVGYSAKTRNTLAAYDEYRIDYSLIVKLLQKLAFDAAYRPFSKAILIFLPGIGEIRQLNDLLTGFPAFQTGWRIHPLHSSFTSDDQQAAFEIPPDGTRKIVLATNIAETGITIPDVTAVIDTGKHKEMRFDEKRQMSRLILSFIAKANAKQRRGRAGRVQEGICFHLFTKQRHDELMAENQAPEMLRLSLSDLVMRVKICKLGNIEQALSQALDPPSSRNIRRAIDALIEVDALTAGEELTTLGAQLAKLPMDVQLGKLILLGCVFGCLDFALTAAATLSSKSPFLNPMHAKKQADTVRLGYKRGDSDLLTVYNAYSVWRKTCSTPGLSEYQFCNKNFLSPQNLASIEDLKAQLLSSLVSAGFVTLTSTEQSALSKVRPGSRQRNFVELPELYRRADDNDAVVQSVVAWSFYPKIVKQEGKGWRNIANNQSLGLHPTSVNKHSLPTDIKLLSFYSIMQSSSRFTNAQETTPVPEIAMVLLAGDAVFHMYAGVIVIDGNRLRYKVKDWKTMVVLKTLRAKLKEMLARLFKAPGKELVGKHRVVMEILQMMFASKKRVQ